MADRCGVGVRIECWERIWDGAEAWVRKFSNRCATEPRPPLELMRRQELAWRGQTELIRRRQAIR